MATIEKIAKLNAVEFADDGTVYFRLKKVVLADDEVLQERWHRSLIVPGASVPQQVAAINAHLELSGFDPVPNRDVARLQSIVQSVQTPEIVKAYRDAEKARDEGRDNAPNR